MSKQNTPGEEDQAMEGPKKKSQAKSPTSKGTKHPTPPGSSKDPAVHQFTPATLQTIYPPPRQRILVLSDIHGNLPFFQGLLKKLNFSPQDLLILLGDMIEKGQDSLALLDHIMDLQTTHQVLPLCGNCDAYVARFFQTDVLDSLFFQHYLQANPQSALRQMADRAQIPFTGDLPQLRQGLRHHFPQIYQWLHRLPTIINSPRYTFVHGGLPSTQDFQGLDAWDCMKNDYFYDKNLSFSKYLVVGHCPTTLYHPDYQDSSPIIDHQRKILSIDGACVLKRDGQLNALILEGDQISWDFYDGLPQIQALEGQEPSADPLNIRWGRSKLQILEEGEEFSLCRHLESGRTLPILTAYLLHREDGTHCHDSTDYCLPVAAGDHLSLVEPVKGGCLAKKQGLTGWYWGKYRNL